MVSFSQGDGAGDNNDSVNLSLAPVRDSDMFDDEITLTIDAAKLPNGYQVSSPPSARNSWTVKISDIDKRMVSFRSGADSSATESGDAVMNEITISPALADDVIIPLRITGSTGTYSISTSSSAGASYADGMVSFIQGIEDKSATLEFQATNDTDNRDETVTLAIDADRLPRAMESATTQPGRSI